MNQQEQYLQKYNQLPRNLQNTMISYESANVIYETAEKEGILPQVSIIAEIAGDVMMGLVPITQFRQKIQDELGITEEKARRIAGAIRDKIFMQVKDELRKIHGLK